jgi:hypothetical protein
MRIIKWCEQIKENEMGGACNMHENCTNFFWGGLETVREGNFKALGLCGRIIL